MEWEENHKNSPRQPWQEESTLKSDVVKVRELSQAEVIERENSCPAPRRVTDPIVAALEELQNGCWVYSGTWASMPERKPEIITQLLRLFERSDRGNAKFRSHVAGHLTALGVAAGHDYIVSQLQNPDPELRRLALVNWEIKSSPPKDQSEIAVLLALLNDPDRFVRDQALGPCAQLGHDIAAPAFESLFKAGDHPRRGWILFALIKYEGVEKYFDAAVALLNQSAGPDETEWALRTLCHVIQKGPPEFSSKARSAVEDFYIHSSNKHRLDQGNIRTLTEVATESTVPALIVVVELASDDISRIDALAAIARLKPALALELPARRPKSSLLHPSILRAFRTSASAQHWNALVAIALEALAGKRERFHLSDAIIDLLLDHGGEAGRRAVEREIPGLWAPTRMYALWQLNGWTIQDALNDLKQRGIIDSLPAPALIEKVREEYAWLERKDAGLFHDILREAGILRKISSEADICPLNYWDLLAEFARITDGVFAPSGCRQEIIKKPVDDPEFIGLPNKDRISKLLESFPTDEEFYQVSFLMGGRLFEFEAFESERTFDVDAAWNAVEAALQKTGQPKRLVQAYAEDGPRLFIWGDPGPVREFCHAFAIPLSNTTLPL